MLPDFEPFDADAGRRRIPRLRRARSGRTSATRRPGCTRPSPTGRRLLFEGAQGSLLDVDHGSYPYVTSSNTSAAGIAAGSGVPTRHIDRWIGIVKAYTTRVGGGPFPTEQDNETGERIRQVGQEYGTVTGRPRRCGWFDAVAVRYSARVSGSTEIAVMLLDVLSGLDELQVAVAYEDDDGPARHRLPGHLDDLERCRPVYETLPGWREDLTGARSWSDLPAAARDYVRFLAAQIGVPVSIVSVGPDRVRRSWSERTDARMPRAATRPTPDATGSPDDRARARLRRPDLRRRPGDARRAGPAARAVAPARRHHHGRQRPLGRAPGPAPDRRPPPGHPSVRAVVEEGCRLGLEQLTLYCLSVENWKRPPRELKFLMRLLRHFLVGRAGRADGAERPADDDRPPRRACPTTCSRELDRTAAADRRQHRDDPLPGRQLRRPDRDRRRRPPAGRGRPRRPARPRRRSTRTVFAAYLYTAGMPDPDLLIRTAGELRVSNFLLWQISYAEICVTDVLWPDFRGDDLHAALLAFARRQRKFGGCPTGLL